MHVIKCRYYRPRIMCLLDIVTDQLPNQYKMLSEVYFDTLVSVLMFPSNASDDGIKWNTVSFAIYLYLYVFFSKSNQVYFFPLKHY